MLGARSPGAPSGAGQLDARRLDQVDVERQAERARDLLQRLDNRQVVVKLDRDAGGLA
jgi:hypothetical protein